jgi:hypothetical protein
VSAPNSSGIERRKSRRRPIMESFSFFVVIPKKGYFKLKVADVSDSGVGFDYDIGGESPEDFPVKDGEEFELHLYLNQTLFLPLQVRVMRVDDSKVIRRVGAEFVTRDTPEYQGLVAFLEMIDRLSEVVQFNAQPE